MYSQWLDSIVNGFFYFERYAQFPLPNQMFLKYQTSHHQKCKSWGIRNSSYLFFQSSRKGSYLLYINLQVHLQYTASFQISRAMASGMSHPKPPCFLNNGWNCGVKTDICCSSHHQILLVEKTDPGSHLLKTLERKQAVFCTKLELSRAPLI